MNNSATIYLKRATQAQDKSRKYRVYLDDVLEGEINADEILKLQITPGKHSINLTIDWGSSNKMDFSAEAGQELFLECGYNIGGNFWETISPKTESQNHYLYIKESLSESAESSRVKYAAT